MDTEEKPRGDRGRDGREAATSPGTDAWSPQNLEEAERTLPWSLCRGPSPGADAGSPQKLEDVGRTLPWSLCREPNPGTP